MSLDKNAVEHGPANNGAGVQTPFSHAVELPFAFQLLDLQCSFVFLEHLRGLEDVSHGQFYHSFNSWCCDKEESFFEPLTDLYFTACRRKRQQKCDDALHLGRIGRKRPRSVSDVESRRAIDVCMSGRTVSEPDDKEDRIAFVLGVFRTEMRQSERELVDAENRLRTDDFYYEGWCTRLHEWHTNCPARFWPPSQKGGEPEASSTGA